MKNKNQYCFLDIRSSLLTVMVALLIFMASLTSIAWAKGNDIQGKLGASYASDPDKFGLDFAMQYNWLLDRYFVIGLESGFLWLEWDRKIGKSVSGQLEVDLKADTDAYVIPFMFNSQLRLPNLINQRNDDIIPFFNVGLGWHLVNLHYSQPDYIDAEGNEYQQSNINRLYYGFAWQVMLGVMIKIADDSKVHFLTEVGYRNSKPTKNNEELNLSGMTLRAGVRFPLSDN